MTSQPPTQAPASGRAQPPTQLIIESSINRMLNICPKPVVQTNNAAILNINCNPPPEWHNMIYMSPQCVDARMNKHLYTPEQVCNACYACCANNITQTMITDVKTSCIAQSDFGLNLINDILYNMANESVNSAKLETIRNMLSPAIMDAVGRTINQVSSLQTINVNGVGTVSHIRQNIVSNVLFNNIVMDSLLERIDAILQMRDDPILETSDDPILETPDNTEYTRLPMDLPDDSPPLQPNAKKNNMFFIVFIIFIIAIAIFAIIRMKRSPN